MSAQEIFSQQEADALLTKDEEELTQLLSMRINAVQQDVGLTLQPSFSVRKLEEGINR